MSDKKQTALKWFVEQLGLDSTNDYKEEIEQALQMEREQIEDAFNNGIEETFSSPENGEQFYKETYGGQDE